MTDEPIDKDLSNLDFQEVEDIIKNMKEKNKMDEKTHEVASHESWLLPTSEACEIPTHPNFNPNHWITPTFGGPSLPAEDKYKNFCIWLDGYLKAVGSDEIFTDDIRTKLEELEL